MYFQIEGKLVSRHKVSSLVVEEQPGLLAHHWECSDDEEQALHFLLRAGDAARLAYAHQEAIDFYLRALDLLTEAGQPEREARIWMKLGLAHHTAFQFKRAEAAYQAAFAAWQRPSTADSATLSPPAQALRIGMLEPLTLDPALPYDLASVEVISQLYSGLAAVTPEADVVPEVASSWEVSEDGRRYTFHLRPDARWSDGTLVTAQDFEYAWKRVLNPGTESPYPSMMYDIQGAQAYHSSQASSPDAVAVRAPDDHTLDVELAEPAAYFLQLLSFAAFMPLSRHATDKWGPPRKRADGVPTNGSFTLGSWEQGVRATLLRNPLYGGVSRGNVQQVQLVFIPNGPCPEALALYRRDELDICQLGTVPPTELKRLSQVYAGDFVPGPSGGVFFLVFDLRHPPFDDPRVRQAFALSIDRDRLIAAMPGGCCTPATGGLVPPWIPGHTPEIAPPFNPEEARALLAAAGYPRGAGFPDIDMYSSQRLERFTHSLVAQWRDTLGVEVSASVLERSEYYQKVAAAPPHIHWRSWVADYPDPDSFLRVGVRLNTNWRDGEFDRQIEEARRIADQPTRLRLYRRADHILIEQAPFVCISYDRRPLLVKPWVRKFQAAWKDIIIEPH